MKRLLILRHAKSSWADSSLDDWQRPLNDRGRRDAPRAGEWLRARSRVPDCIVTSDAVRARTTAQAVAQAAGYSGDIIVEPSLYQAAAPAMFAVLNGLADAVRTALIVGHNPGLEQFLRQLTGEFHDLPTAALVELSMAIEHWNDLDETTTASIVEMWLPRDQ